MVEDLAALAVLADLALEAAVLPVTVYQGKDQMRAKKKEYIN